MEAVAGNLNSPASGRGNKLGRSEAVNPSSSLFLAMQAVCRTSSVSIANLRPFHGLRAEFTSKMYGRNAIAWYMAPFNVESVLSPTEILVRWFVRGIDRGRREFSDAPRHLG